MIVKEFAEIEAELNEIYAQWPRLVCFNSIADKPSMALLTPTRHRPDRNLAMQQALT